MVGCLWPILRNIVTVAGLFIAGAVVSLRMQDVTWLFIILGGGIALLWLLDKTVFATRNQRERAAQKRFFGLDR